MREPDNQDTPLYGRMSIILWRRSVAGASSARLLISTCSGLPCRSSLTIPPTRKRTYRSLSMAS